MHWEYEMNCDVVKVNYIKKQMKDIVSIVRWNIIGEGM